MPVKNAVALAGFVLGFGLTPSGGTLAQGVEGFGFDALPQFEQPFEMPAAPSDEFTLDPPPDEFTLDPDVVPTPDTLQDQIGDTLHSEPAQDVPSLPSYGTSISQSDLADLVNQLSEEQRADVARELGLAPQGSFQLGAVGFEYKPSVEPQYSLRDVSSDELQATAQLEAMSQLVGDKDFDKLQREKIFASLASLIPPSELQGMPLEDLVSKLRERGIPVDPDNWFFLKHVIGGYDPIDVALIEEATSGGYVDRRSGEKVSFFVPGQPTPSNEEIAQLARATGIMVVLNLNQIDFVITDDALMVSPMPVYGDKGGDKPVCDSSAKDEPIMPLGLCSGVLAQRQGEEPVFVTAGHCMEKVVGGDLKVAVIFDFVASQYVPGSRMFVSRSYGLLDLTKSSVRSALPDDIAAAGIDFAARPQPSPVPFGDTALVAEGLPVGSFAHPLARPKKAVFGEKTLVGEVHDEYFQASLDNFQVSSGSPVFNYGGELLGILTFQFDPQDFQELSTEEGVCMQETIVTDLSFPWPKITRITRLQ